VYRVSEYQTEVAEFTCDVDGCFDVATFGARYISEGSTDNLILRGRVKLLITPSGSLNILEVNTSVECPG
jgi:branched-subunit amino acid aminotransferase/4-amino-4-deoxychorismate lyase